MSNSIDGRDTVKSPPHFSREEKKIQRSRMTKSYYNSFFSSIEIYEQRIAELEAECQQLKLQIKNLTQEIVDLKVHSHDFRYISDIVIFSG